MNSICKCGNDYDNESEFTKDKCFCCFLGEETPHQIARKKWVDSLSPKQREEYFEQLEQDMYDYNQKR